MFTEFAEQPALRFIDVAPPAPAPETPGEIDPLTGLPIVPPPQPMNAPAAAQPNHGELAVPEPQEQR
jgi:hypothetical protein